MDTPVNEHDWLDPGGVARWWVDPWVGELVSSGGTVSVNGRK